MRKKYLKDKSLMANDYWLKTTQKGQVLLEAIVALSILTVGMLGIFSILPSSIGSSRAAANKEIAVGLASEGIEVVKSILDANVFSGGAWNSGLTGCSGGCSVQYDEDSVSPGAAQYDRFLKFDSGTGFYNYDTGVDSPFKRRIVITGIAPAPVIELKVTSTVTWTERGGVAQSVVLEDRFFNWR